MPENQNHYIRRDRAAMLPILNLDSAVDVHSSRSRRLTSPDPLAGNYAPTSENRDRRHTLSWREESESEASKVVHKMRSQDHFSRGFDSLERLIWTPISFSFIALYLIRTHTPPPPYPGGVSLCTAFGANQPRLRPAENLCLAVKRPHLPAPKLPCFRKTRSKRKSAPRLAFHGAQQLHDLWRRDPPVVRREQAECLDGIVLSRHAAGLRAVERPVTP
jgi:hypothetical protein